MLNEKTDKKEGNKADFIALAVHRLKTPISSIKLSLEMLLEEDFGGLSDEQKRVLERMQQKNKTLIYLVNDLLNLAKIKDKHLGNLKYTDFEKLVQSIVDFEKEAIQKKRIEIKVQKQSDKLPNLKLNQEKVFLALQNIIDNAIKYSKIGGEVIISLSNDNRNLNVKVQDFGIGVLDKEKNKLFTEFFRGENAKELEPMGSGLGLYIAKNIIEEKGGKIWFESPARNADGIASAGGKENKGSTFFISLPIK